MSNKISFKLNAMNKADLKNHVNDLRRQLLSLRLNARVSHVKDYSQFKKLRKSIACGLTVLQQMNVVGNNKKSSELSE